jgi:hypothetical protein
MDFRDELLTVAELAIGIAGFSAVVAAFAHRGDLQQRDIDRFRILVTSAGAAVILAFLPSLLSGLSFSEENLWRSASGLMAIAGLGGMIPFSLRVLSEKRRQGTGSKTNTSVVLAIMVPSIANIFLQIGNGVGNFWTPNGAIYLFGALVWLWSAGAMFIDIVANRPRTQ